MKFFDWFTESPEMLLSKLRLSIDKIDLQLIELLGYRFSFIRQIANIKKHHDLPIEDPERNMQIKKNVELMVRLHNLPVEPEIKRIFNTIINASIDYQKSLLSTNKQTNKKQQNQPTHPKNKL